MKRDSESIEKHTFQFNKVEILEALKDKILESGMMNKSEFWQFDSKLLNGNQELLHLEIEFKRQKVSGKDYNNNKEKKKWKNVKDSSQS